MLYLCHLHLFWEHSYYPLSTNGYHISFLSFQTTHVPVFEAELFCTSVPHGSAANYSVFVFFFYYHCSLRKIIIRCYVHSTLLSRHLLKHLKNYKNGLCFQIIYAVWQDENLSSAHHTLFSVNVLLFIKQVLCLINSQNITSVVSQNWQRKRLGLSHIA